MEENNENSKKFKTVQDPNAYKKVLKKEKNNNNYGFGRNFLLPFFSGILGCTLVVGTCFGVPSIKSKLLSNTNNISNTNSSSQNSGYVSQTSLSNYSDTSIYAANKILPSIVGIKVEYNVNSLISMFGNSGQTSTASASGSGIIISEDGYILTNNHIVSTSSSESYYEVSEATKLTVTLFNDDTEYEAKIIGTDEQTDLAVLKIEKTGLTAAELGDSSKVQVGEFAMAIGNPLNMASTVTTGVISATNRTITSDNVTYKVIQTDAAINSGNSGGALINADGKVIGINTLKLSGSGVEGIGFAIPINDTIDVYKQLIENGKVARPYIGMSGRDISEEVAKKNNLPKAGVYVVSVEEFSAAEKAGIKAGDLIVAFDGEDVTTMDKLNELKNKHNIGDEVKIKLIRNGEEKEVSITLGENKGTNEQ